MANNTCPWGVGSKTSTLIAFESTYGVTPTDAGSKSVNLPFNTNGVAASQNTTAPATIRGNRNPVEPILGNIDVSGDVVVPVDYTAFGYWLKACFDAPTSAKVGSTTNYKHTFRIGDSQPSFTLEKAFPGINTYVQENGCKVSKLSLSVGGDGELTATISAMGAKETIQEESMATAPVEAAFNRAQNFQAKVKIGGAVKGKLTTFSLDVDFGLDGDTYCIGGNGYREAIGEGLATVSGTLEAFFDGDDYIAMAKASTETSIEIIITNGDFELSILLPEAKFAVTSPSIDGPSGIKQSLSYNAYYEDGAEQSAVVLTLTNQMETY